MNKQLCCKSGAELSNNNAFSQIDSLKFLYNKANCLFKIRNIAFTLAETLIVMGIIGVVAALTIPNLNSSTSHKETVVKVKKIYSDLAEAHNRVIAVYGAMENIFSNASCTYAASCGVAKTRYTDRMKEFLKLSKDCSGYKCNDFVNIYSNKIKNLADEDYGAYYSSDPICILADGAAIIKLNISNNCNNDSYSVFTTSVSSKVVKSASLREVCGFIAVDIDGPYKGKNKIGVDIFSFAITKSGIEDYSNLTSANLKRHCFYSGLACTAWIIENNNLDYLEASHTSTSDAGVCKNGKQLGYDISAGQVTSCK